MKLPLFALLCCLVASATIKGQVANRNVALLVVECEATQGLCATQRLIRYRFKDGEQVSRDTVLTTPTNIVRYDLGQNHIYLSRYVITEWGDVVDVQTGKLLHDGRCKGLE